MTDYLSRLAASLFGTTETIHPRIRSIYESAPEGDQLPFQSVDHERLVAPSRIDGPSANSGTAPDPAKSTGIPPLMPRASSETPSTFASATGAEQRDMPQQLMPRHADRSAMTQPKLSASEGDSSSEFAAVTPSHRVSRRADDNPLDEFVSADSAEVSAEQPRQQRRLIPLQQSARSDAVDIPLDFAANSPERSVRPTVQPRLITFVPDTRELSNEALSASHYTPATESAKNPSPAPEPPSITIHIGRVEVRTTAPNTAPAKASPHAVRHTLEQYLQERNEGKS